jgi:hypothetical protein
MAKILDLKGRRLGRLLVIERVKVRGTNNAMWRCLCDCGNETVAAAANIGKTTFSCGCLAKETAASLLRGNTHTMTHGGCGTDEYRTWQLIKRRCYNTNDEKYPIYGGRGIKVCKEWKDDFPQFLADMEPRPSKAHSIERKDVNGDYTKDNCKWATSIEQARNTTRNVFVEINGKTRCVAEWCDLFGVSRVKPYDMCRGTGRDRCGPPAFDTIEDAIRELYRRHAKPAAASRWTPVA